MILTFIQRLVPRGNTAPLTTPHTPTSGRPPTPHHRCKWSVLGLVTLLTLAIGCGMHAPWVTNRQGSIQQAMSRVKAGLPDAMTAATGTRDLGEDAVKGPFAIARLSERRGQPEKAEPVYLKMIERYPDNAHPYHRLGVIRAKSGDWKAAERYLQMALDRDPDGVEILADLGYLHYLQNQPEKAEACLRHALDQQPNHVQSCNNLAIVLGEQERDEECRELFQRVCQPAEVHANMAFVYAQRGELDRAVEAYSRALSSDQSLKPAAEALVQLAAYMPDEQPPAEGQGLVYMIESASPSPTGTGRERKVDVAQASLSDADTSPEQTVRTAATSDTAGEPSGATGDRTRDHSSAAAARDRRTEREPTGMPRQLISQPALPAGIPMSWQPPPLPAVDVSPASHALPPPGLLPAGVVSAAPLVPIPSR